MLQQLSSAYHNRDLLFASRRINQLVRSGSVGFNMQVDMDFPVTEQQAHEIEEIKVLSQYGIGFIKEVFLNLNSMYVTGTFKFRHI